MCPLLYPLTIFQKGGHRDDSRYSINFHNDDVFHADDDARKGINIHHHRQPD